MNGHIGGRGRTGLAAVVASLAIGALAACASILNVDSDRSLSAPDSAAAMPRVADGESPDRAPVAEASPENEDGGAFQGQWACLNNPSETFQPGAMTNVQVLSIDTLQPFVTAQQIDGGSAFDVIQYSALYGFSMRACASFLYPQCDNGTGSPWMTSDDAGAFSFTLPQSFAGFFQLGPADAGLFTTNFFPGQFVAGQTADILPAEFLTLAETQQLEFVLPNLQFSFDPSSGLGHVLLMILDCNDQTASGVSVESDRVNADGGTYPTTIFYSQGNGIMEVPTTTAPATDLSGTAGIVNVPAGEFQVRVYLKSTNQTLGTINVSVAPGLASFAYFRARTH